MQSVTRQLDKTGKRMQKLGTGLSKSLTAPLVGIGVLGVKTFADFEDGMAKVQAISGATGSEFKALEIDAKKLGETTRFTATQVAQLQLNFSKLGFNPTEILAATAATLDLALATGEDLASSATVAASTLRGFGLEATETQRIVDVMAASFSSSSLDLEKFKTAMATVAPVAKNAGVSLEDATGQLAVLVNAGVDAATAGTGLRNIYLDIAGSGETLEGSLGKIANSTNKNATAFKLFGKRGATVAAVLADNYSAAKQFGEQFDNASGSAAKMAAIMDDTLKGSLLRLKSAVEGAFISIGEQLAPAVKGLADSIAGAVGKFSEFSESTKKTILIVGGLLAALGPVIIITGTLIRNVATLIPLIKALSVAMATNPVGAFVVAISALAGGVFLAYKHVKKLTNESKKFNALTPEITANINKATKAIKDEQLGLNSLVTSIVNTNDNEAKRKGLIEELNKEYPFFLKFIDDEKIGNDSLKTALETVNKQYIKRLALTTLQERLNVKGKQQDAANATIKASKATERYNKVLGKVNFNLFKGETDNLSGSYQKQFKTLQGLINAQILRISIAKRNNTATQADIKNLSVYENALKTLNKEQGRFLAGTSGEGQTNAILSDANRQVKELSENLKLTENELENFFAASQTEVIINVKPKIVVSGGGDDLDLLDLENAADFDGLDELLAATADKVDQAAEDLTTKNIFAGFAAAGVGALNGLDQNFGQWLDNFNAKAERMAVIGQAVGEQVGAAFSDMAGSLVNSLGLADTGFQGFIKGLVATITKLIAMMLASSISQSIAGATASGVATGPAAIFTTPAFIATAVGGVLAAFAAIPKFETGGIVGGNSLYGDKLLARVNSQELILNTNQQKKLYNLTTPGNGGGGETFIASSFLRGDDIITVYERAKSKQNRIGS